MKNSIATILEQLYNNNLNFVQACEKISNSLLEDINKEIYKEIENDN